MISLLLAAVLLAPGAEKDVQKLLDGPPDFGAYKLEGVRLTEYAIEVRLARATDRLVVELQPLDAVRTGRKIGTTKSFSVWLTGGQDAMTDAAGRALVDRIAPRDDGTFFASHALERPSTASPTLVTARSLGAPDTARRAVMWLVLIVLVAISVWTAQRDWKWWLFLVALAGGAIALRLMLPPWAPLHANMHGIAELRGLASPAGAWQGPVETDRYGFAYRQIVRAVIGLWGGHAGSALAFGAVAGGLSVIPLALLASMLFESRVIGAVAGVALALHPAHIALSLSENPMALAGLLVLVGLACALASAADARRRKVLAWAAAIALACGAELSVASLFLAVAGAVAIALWRCDALPRPLQGSQRKEESPPPPSPSLRPVCRPERGGGWGRGFLFPLARAAPARDDRAPHGITVAGAGIR